MVHDENTTDDNRFAYTTPCAAYITFETQEGYERATLYWDKSNKIDEIKNLVPDSHKVLLGEELFFE
jgi:hypothetical protein